MGSVKSFTNWLAGKTVRSGATPIQQTVMALKIFNRQLDGQRKRMESQLNQAKEKAKERKDRNDRDAAFRLMKSAIQYEKWLKKLDEFRFNLEDMDFQLNAAHDMGNFDEVGEDLLRVLCELRLTLGMPQIQQMLDELDLGFGNMRAVYLEYIKKYELDQTHQSIRVSNEEVATIFGESPEPDPNALPSVPGSKKEPENPDEVFDLEAELDRLRKKRNE